jgi:hypothetical protein
MQIKIEIVHYIKGRMRIIIHAPLDTRVLFMIIETILHEIEEIKRADLNNHTNSVTIIFLDKGGARPLVQKLRDILYKVLKADSFKERYKELKTALNYYERNKIKIRILEDYEIGIGYDDSKKIIRKGASMPLTESSAFSATTFSVGLGTLLLLPSLPTPAWLVILIFGYTTYKQMEQNRALSLINEDIILKRLKSQRQLEEYKPVNVDNDDSQEPSL